MRSLSAMCLSAVALGLSLPGCVAEHASAIDEAKSELGMVPPKPADPNDPFGSCQLDETQTSYPFPGACSQGGACNGWSSLDCVVPESGGPCEHATFWQWCSHECESDSDCPQPQTGDVAVQCLAGSCHLPCSDGETCPDGFSCWSPSEVGGWTSLYGAVCAQYFEVTDFIVPPL